MKPLYKSILLLFFFSLSVLQLATAQNAIESTAEFNKAEHPVFTTSFPYPPKIVKGALLQKLDKNHIRAKEHRHLIACKGVVYPKLSNEPLDLYFQTDGRDKKGKGFTTLNLFVSKGKDNFIGEKYDKVLSAKALAFLSNLRPEVKYYALQQEIKEKDKILKKVRKDYQKELKDKQGLYNDLYKRKKELSAATGKDIKKTKRKIHRINKKIRKAEGDIKDGENQMNQIKGKIQVLQTKLAEMNRMRENS